MPSAFMDTVPDRRVEQRRIAFLHGIRQRSREQGRGQLAMGELDRIGPVDRMRAVPRFRATALRISGTAGLASPPMSLMAFAALKRSQRSSWESRRINTGRASWLFRYAERLAGSLAGMGVRSFRHLDQLGRSSPWLPGVWPVPPPPSRARSATSRRTPSPVRRVSSSCDPGRNVPRRSPPRLPSYSTSSPGSASRPVSRIFFNGSE